MSNSGSKAQGKGDTRKPVLHYVYVVYFGPSCIISSFLDLVCFLVTVDSHSHRRFSS